MLAVDESSLQVDRILQSETLRSSESLKRLFRYLAEKSLKGEADNLKEYAIGIDAFGKPSAYDPRHDSTVRIQVGRLRQKLMEYYQTEGKDDLIIVDLPKGRFKLSWHPREIMVSSDALTPAADIPLLRRSSRLWLGLGILTITAWAGYATVQLQAERRSTAVFRSQWTPEVETLWKPFVGSDRSLLVSISAPLFVDFPGYGTFRDSNINRPEDVKNSKIVAEMEKAFKGATARPLIYFSTIGDANVTFNLGRLLASRKANVSVVNGNELSWQQVSENNIIYIGSPKFFNQQLNSMPVRTELLLEPRVGVHNLHPRGQESSTYIDEYPQSRATGVGYALISHTPGPLGIGDVMSFAGRNGAAILGAVQMFTETSAARTLLSKLRKASGAMPRYYQVLLKVRFQDGVPLETSYILHRELLSNRK
jgi:hypothetical protein